MSAEVFIPRRMHAATLDVVEQANVIIAEYLAQGFALSLRQLFYQMVSRALLENSFKEYKRLGVIVRDGRNGGLIDWDAIEDRARVVNTHSSWESPADIIKSAANSYKTDWWQNQLYRPEVWIEKNALIGVIEGVCTELREALIDWPKWEAAQAEERQGRKLLAAAAEKWAKVEKLLRRAS